MSTAAAFHRKDRGCYALQPPGNTLDCPQTSADHADEAEDIDRASRVEVSILQAPEHRGIRRSSSVQSHTTMRDSIRDSEQSPCAFTTTSRTLEQERGARSKVASETGRQVSRSETGVEKQM